jgi:hypothetical protein
MAVPRACVSVKGFIATLPVSRRSTCIRAYAVSAASSRAFCFFPSCWSADSLADGFPGILASQKAKNRLKDKMSRGKHEVGRAAFSSLLFRWRMKN